MTHEEAWKDLAERLERARVDLNRLATTAPTLRSRDRLDAKADGVALVQSYMRDYESRLA